MRSRLVAFLGMVGAISALTSIATAGPVERGPGALSDTVSLGRRLAEGEERAAREQRAVREERAAREERAEQEVPVHIFYVHGMGATGPGASAQFREELCKRLKGCSPLKISSTVHRVDLGDRPKVTVGGSDIWDDDTKWKRSQPFKITYTLPRGSGEPVVVEEVNWWPLLLPFKCKMLVGPDAKLSGANKEQIEICKRDHHVLTGDNESPLYYPWLKDFQLEPATSFWGRRGGAALNASLKQSIMNWGMADAVLVNGPMRSYFHKAMRSAFGASLPKDQLDRRFVIISESLGSFVTLDAFGSDVSNSIFSGILRRTYALYMFANQYALLELGRVDMGSSGGQQSVSAVSPGENPPQRASQAPEAQSVLRALEKWADPGEGGNEALSPTFGTSRKEVRQIIAFNDPSDVLTFPMPCVRGAVVVNVDVRQSFNVFGLFADPIGAHTAHATSADVLRIMFDPRNKASSSPDRPDPCT